MNEAYNRRQPNNEQSDKDSSRGKSLPKKIWFRNNSRRIRNFDRIDLIEVDLRHFAKLRSDEVVKVLERIGLAGEVDPTSLFVTVDFDAVLSQKAPDLTGGSLTTVH